ncbi:hypothetical protein [Rahnella woolbedingensis]|uniref:hypothetical protein n=1 Tax=Rahnella woolbedingensis TaxID=1510574 RepID=UPI0011C40250|nr:hypothetical protein [Rahnella woolbedingensis]
MPSPVIIIYKKAFLIKGQAPAPDLTNFPQKNNASFFCCLKRRINWPDYLTASNRQRYIYDMTDDYLQSHELLMVYMNKFAREDEIFSTGNNV